MVPRGADISEDGRFLIVGVSLGTDPKNLLYYVDLAQLNYTIKGGLTLDFVRELVCLRNTETHADRGQVHWQLCIHRQRRH